MSADTSSSSSSSHRHPHPRPPRSYDLLVTAYTGDVVPLTYDVSNNTLRTGNAKVSGLNSPSWITSDGKPRAPRYFITGEATPGKVYVAEASSSSASQIKLIGDAAGYATGGDGPVASALVGSCLYVANYNSGSATVLELHHDGLPNGQRATIQYTRQGTGPVPTRQDHPYAHDAVVSPDGKWVYIVDLGSDTIHRIRAHSTDCAKARDAGSTSVAAGSGPRHIAFFRDPHTHNQFAYLTSELVNTLTAFAHEPHTGELTMIGTPILSAPPGTPLGGTPEAGAQRTTAELAISPDGRFLYVSERGDDVEDHIAIFTRDAQSGRIIFLKWTPSGGRNPRHFSMSHDGRYLAVAHQASNNTVILARDADTGDVRKTGAVADGLEQVNFAGFV